MGRTSAAVPMLPRRCAACSCTPRRTSRGSIAAFDAVLQAHRPPAPGLPLFSLGERPRVVAGRRPACAVHAELEGIRRRNRGAQPARSAPGAPPACSRTKDFAEFTDRRARARPDASANASHGTCSLRRTRRWQRASSGAAISGRCCGRSVMRGDLIDLPRRTRREVPRPIVVLGDVSGSMERYSRVLLHFVYGLAHSATRVEVFLFATRLTRVTPYADRRRGAHVHWRGLRAKCRTGAAARASARRCARSTCAGRAASSATVPWCCIVSDGWDRGDPAVLDRELARVRRSCRRLIWLNPLLGSAQYEPLTRGMQAGLRHVDDFLPAHNLVSLEQLANHLRALPGRTRPVSWHPRHRSASWS